MVNTKLRTHKYQVILLSIIWCLPHESSCKLERQWRSGSVFTSLPIPCFYARWSGTSRHRCLNGLHKPTPNILCDEFQKSVTHTWDWRLSCSAGHMYNLLPTRRARAFRTLERSRFTLRVASPRRNRNTSEPPVSSARLRSASRLGHFGSGNAGSWLCWSP